MKNKFRTELYQIVKPDPRNKSIRNTLRFCLFPNDNAVSSSIIGGWQYEPYLFEFLQKNQIETLGREIIDVGANNGNFAVDFAHLVGDKGVVHCFEPQRIVFQQLCGNIFLNGLDNVYTYNFAVGDMDAIISIDEPNYHALGQVNFGDVSVGSELGAKVKQVSLDDFEFKDIAFMKFDVQGYEEKAIRGAINTIQKHRPILFVEFEEHLLQKFESSEALLQVYIESLDYAVYRFQEGIPYQTVSGKCLDCVCIPNELDPPKFIIP